MKHAGMNYGLTLRVTGIGLFLLTAACRAGLDITASSTPLAPPKNDPSILAHHARDDIGGNTSIRFVSNRTVSTNKYPPEGITVFSRADRQKPQRDRDLGQTFLAGDQRCRLDALYLRIGHADLAVLENTPGARIAVQWFQVTGRPKLNDHGTPGFAGRFDRTVSPELDDYLEGETYLPLRVVEGRLPKTLTKGDYLKLDFTGEDEFIIEPRRGYAFLLMFPDRAPNRGMTLANEYYGTYTPDPENKYIGHGIRREGTPEFPDDWRARLTQSPGTIGFPDVCTFRDLHFAVSVKPVSETPTAFPLSISENKRYLVDSTGKPFFYQADTAWMLLLKLDPAQAEEYLINRKTKGFNTVQIMMTGFLDMKNLSGQRPFEGEHDLARPNEAFFAHADGVIRMASDMGLLLAIAPAWSGCCGEGWAGTAKNGSPKPLNKNGAAKCRQYGRWLGERYGKFDNILWILGGDNDPDNAREEIRQIGLGLKEAAPRHLITYHAASSHSSTDVWPADERWLDVSMVYTYFRGFNKAWNKNQPDVYEVSHAEYAKSRVRPFFLGESTYEGEHEAWGSALQARKQAFWCVLGGGFGHAYGSPNWNFPKNWREVMEQPGAVSLKHVRGLFESLPWWTLTPDVQNTIVVEGRGQWAANNYITASRTSDGSRAIVYLPSARPITVDLSRLSGSVTAKWYDPTSGMYRVVEESPFSNEGRRTIDPPKTNADGDSDWVLLLVAEGVKQTAGSTRTQAVLLDPMAEFDAAQQAEKAGRFDEALTHYENIFDSTQQPMKFPSRAMLRGKLAELKRKVSPNTDPEKAGQWKVKAYTFRTTDVKWTDNDGKERHARFDFTDSQIENLKLEMTNFAAKVWDYSDGHLRIVWDMTVIDKPLTEWHGWPELGVCMPHFTELNHGQADSIFVFAKAAGGPEDKPCDPLAWDLWGGTIGVTAETKGACYIGFNCGPEPAQNSSGELELHEWTHAAEMAMRWAQAYEDGDVVDWYGDGGDYCETWGLWKRPAGDETWLDFYQAIFREWTTRKMWRELTVNGHSDNPWLRPYVRQFVALGPFNADGKANGGLDEPFIDEAAAKPKEGAKVGGLEWKRANCPGKFATLTPVFGTVGDGKVYYLAFTAKSEESQNALLHSQRDGMCKIWQNGELIYTSKVNREWSSKSNVLDIALTQGDNRFLVKLTNISGDWSFSLKLTDLGGDALPTILFLAP